MGCRRCRPCPNHAFRLTARFGAKPVVPRKPVKSELQDDFGAARGPQALAFDVIQTFEKAAHIEKQAGKLRSDGMECLLHALARRNDRFRHIHPAAVVSASAVRHSGVPVRGHARHQLRAGEFGAQTLAGCELMRREQRLAVASFAPREPPERAFVIDHHNRPAALRRVDFFRSDIEMLGSERINMLRPQRRVVPGHPSQSRRRDNESAFRISRNQIGGKQFRSDILGKIVDRFFVELCRSAPTRAQARSASSAFALTGLRGWLPREPRFFSLIPLYGIYTHI